MGLCLLVWLVYKNAVITCGRFRGLVFGCFYKLRVLEKGV